MKLTRRRLLGVGTAASLGLAGCVSRGSNVAYPESGTDTPTPSDAAMVDAEPAGDEEVEQAEPSEPTVPNRRLAQEVGQVYGEIAWFATEYDAAIETYRRAVRRAMATVKRVRDSAEFNDNTLELVRNATDRAISVAETELGGHFGIDQQMRSEIGAYMTTVERFGRRGDLDRTDEELTRLYEYLESIQTSLFVRRILSDRQIDDALYRALYDETRDSGDDEEDDDDEDGGNPGLFEIWHSTEFGAYAYDGPRYIDREPFGDDDAGDENEGAELLARQRTLFDAAGEATGRSGFAYVVSYAAPGPDEQPSDLEPLEYPRTSLFIQSYDGVETATTATESLLDGSVTEEGTYSFGRDEWRRVYYDGGGDVVYAFLIQAGPYVVVAAPSEVAWEERVDWTEALGRLWLWTR
jgi:hypothetical protein